MYSFDYVRPRDIEDASSYLASHEDAKPVAGGMSLLPSMKLRLAQPSALVDLGTLETLRRMEVTTDSLTLGAMTRHVDVVRSEVIARAIPALVKLASNIGDRQVRNRGTIGGSVANSDPAACYPSALLALRAVIETSTRSIPVDDYFRGLFETALEPAELITAIHLNVPLAADYQKFKQPASRFAIVGAFVAKFRDEVRVGVTGTKVCAFRWREAEAALQRQFDSNALEGLYLPELDVNSDIHADAEYRVHLVNVMVRRAVENCCSQLG
ncbi:xanthine dehydrogenase family protein subunit M [Bradyrhizobium sp. NP1]|uniref:FAD binding domain-containing protein n=1 Tax=Bradyrhizobium sp. NP1 TaxID=3049772 RepID=UPI0025A62AF0|nr:xanthine dehydrogenase family protein subunit M [Bradyrhizobium sp. NP1]WJR76767.1 xanthine dehydrogenase family protein subunit M [Bradyrhizobium sp. NP1]